VDNQVGRESTNACKQPKYGDSAIQPPAAGRPGKRVCYRSGVDGTEEWTQAQRRVIELARSLSAEQAERQVPACPDWTVTQLLAHMVGLNADVLAGDEPEDHNAAWTQRQVDERAGRDVAALTAEWESLTEAMRSWMREHTSRPMNDVIIHEQDLRGAVSRPGARDTAGLAAVRDLMARRFADRVAAAKRAPVLLWSPAWLFATGEGEPGLELSAPDFDLARALMSRRTAAQLREWTTGGDIEEYLPLFSGLGPLPDSPLPE
jgi:uncharacterized protein (TIGR03083 family)